MAQFAIPLKKLVSDENGPGKVVKKNIKIITVEITDVTNKVLTTTGSSHPKPLARSL